MDKKILRDYLEQVRLLETDIYTMEESLNALEMLRKRLPTYCPPRAPKKPDDPILDLPSKGGTIAGALALTLTTYGIGTIPYLIHRNIKAKKAQTKYDTTIEQNQIMYDQAIKEYDAQLSNYTQNYSANRRSIELFNENLDTQIASLQSQLASSASALEQLYGLNVIYKKYRTLVAITMFCEYLDSGLRTELEGTDGMYDLYEQQLMGKLIINELSAVNKNLRTISFQLGTLSSQLTGIQQNQLMLYEEVAKANSIASDIKRSTEQLLDSSEKHLSAIQNSTEMAAFHSEVTARRTNAIARIAEYEFESKHSAYDS